jgi:hypothetical protein
LTIYWIFDVPPEEINVYVFGSASLTFLLLFRGGFFMLNPKFWQIVFKQLKLNPGALSEILI